MNFCLPIDLNRLLNERLWLKPLEECTDDNLQEFINETCINHPELWTYFPGGPHDSLKAYKAWYYESIESIPEAQIFAIYLNAGTVTKHKPGNDEVESLEVAHGTFAGTIGLINASNTMSKAEIGHVMVLPKFHRTFVHTHASCLLLKHLLDPVSGGDLNLRRVQWQANSQNARSIAAAERLGMTLEGILRWDRTCWENKQCVSEARGSRTDGKPIMDKMGRKLGPGRHSAMLSLCWDDWLEGKREHVMKLMARA